MQNQEKRKKYSDSQSGNVKKAHKKESISMLDVIEKGNGIERSSEDRKALLVLL